MIDVSYCIYPQTLDKGYKQICNQVVKDIRMIYYPVDAEDDIAEQVRGKVIDMILFQRQE